MRISDLFLFNDHHLVVLAKPAGMPVQEDSTGDASLHRAAQAYCKRDLYLVNRLDRPCSGLVVMTKTREAAAHLSHQWKERTVVKSYLAIVPPGIDPESGRPSHIVEKRGKKSFARPAESGEEANATLSYRLAAHLDKVDVLEIETHTGLFHQIRAQLSALGFPIRGDVKYGARRSTGDRSIGLHCQHIAFIHPSTGEQLQLTCPLPEHDIWPVVREQLHPSQNT